MQITFQKIHGAGNDFVVYDNRDGSVELSPQQVQDICDRHRGVGADGIIEVRNSPREECVAYMHYINADGSLAEMCGNGVRCFARYLVDNSIISEEEKAAQSFVVDTLAGPRPLVFEVDEGGSLVQATVIMGEPALAPELIPTALPATQEIAIYDGNLGAQRLVPAVVQAPTSSQDDTFLLTCVNMGNPHAVFFLEDIDEAAAKAFAANPQSFNLDKPGAYLEGNTELFPQKTNVEIATVNGNNSICVRVYERGVGETLACGTGACAVAVAAILLKKANRDEPVAVHLPGGTLTAVWQPDNSVMLTGPAKTVFNGVLEIA